MPSSAETPPPPGPSTAWFVLSALAAAGALIAWSQPSAAWDWQPGLAWAEPWRWWTAAFVHWSPMHLLANLAGTAVLAAFGGAARLPMRAVLAWTAAWPLTQLSLLLQPALAHYGGLSGVLHAGVGAAATTLLLERRGRPQWIGAAVLAGLLAKIALERPWAGPLSHPAGWDIAVAPLAHASGAAWGVALAGVASAVASTVASVRTSTPRARASRPR